MTLTLRVENLTTLPDGGPLSVSIKGKRGLDIGRDQYLDWTLPDPSRFISGKHCEVRWRDGAYWLHDISTNGTFLQGEENRLKEPHRLRDGDRFVVGHYIIAVALDDDAPFEQKDLPENVAAPDYDELWSPTEQAAPPIDPKELRASKDLRPVKPDFLNWAVDVPTAYIPRDSDSQTVGRQWEFQGKSPPEEDSWSAGAPKPAPPPEPAETPSPKPRRPLSGREAGWGATPTTAASEFATPGQTARESPVAAIASAGPLTAGRPNEQDANTRKSGAAHFAPSAHGPNPAVADFARLFARGAGVTDEAFAARDPAEFAEHLGQLMLFVLENIKQLLEARQQTRRLAHVSSQTMIQALNNNPLKFAPTAEDALRIMFGPRTRSYLDARGALAESFDDLKRHQVNTYAAMQHALRLVLDELDPATIEAEFKDDQGFAGIVGSRKARLWDAYVARWRARTQHHEDGMLNAFMDYFAECYERDRNNVR